MFKHIATRKHFLNILSPHGLWCKLHGPQQRTKCQKFVRLYLISFFIVGYDFDHDIVPCLCGGDWFDEMKRCMNWNICQVCFLPRTPRTASETFRTFGTDSGSEDPATYKILTTHKQIIHKIQFCYHTLLLPTFWKIQMIFLVEIIVWYHDISSRNCINKGMIAKTLRNIRGCFGKSCPTIFVKTAIFVGTTFDNAVLIS